MRRGAPKHTHHGVIHVETAKAILFESWWWEEPGWLPRSQITLVRDHQTLEVEVRIADWLATKNEFEEPTCETG